MTNIVFFNRIYLRRFQQVIVEAQPFAELAFDDGTAGRKLYDDATEIILRKIEKFLFVSSKGAKQIDDPELAEALRTFNNALSLIAERERKPLSMLLPTWGEWVRLEARLVKGGIRKQ